MESTQRILARLAWGLLGAGVLFGAMGVYLVFLGATGDSRFSLFGQEFQSGNAGVASIFIGAVLIVLSLRRILATFEKAIPTQEGKRAAGELRVMDVQVRQQAAPATPEEFEPAECQVDFLLSNHGGSQVVISGVDFHVVDTARCELVKGRLESSATYDLDLTELRRPGQVASVPTAQEVEPGRADRFTVRMVARMGSGVFGAWRLRPVLRTNFGEVTAREIEVWLPHPEPETSFAELKRFAAEEAARGAAG
jgi:hypothetical protein